MTFTISKKTYKKFGLVAKISVGTLVCLICIQNVKNQNQNSNPGTKKKQNQTEIFISLNVKIISKQREKKFKTPKYIYNRTHYGVNIASWENNT